MATKKQKREAALAKREEFFQKVLEDGLKAQKKDRERQAILQERLRAEAEAENRR